MKLRHILLAIAALFSLGPIVSHADDGLRLVAITASRVTTALGYTPLNPANNLSEVTPATARTNLGLGTAATVNTGTSGATLPLLSTVNTWSAAQTFSSLSLASGGGNIGLSGGAQIAATGDGNIYIDVGSGGTFRFRNGPLQFPKLTAAPSAAPGAGFTIAFAVAGTNAGTCKLQIMAGTSTTPSTILDNIGSGC